MIHVSKYKVFPCEISDNKSPKILHDSRLGERYGLVEWLEEC